MDRNSRCTLLEAHLRNYREMIAMAADLEERAGSATKVLLGAGQAQTTSDKIATQAAQAKMAALEELARAVAGFNKMIVELAQDPAFKDALALTREKGKSPG